MAGCQVDFYVLETPAKAPDKLACWLALKALDQAQTTQIVVESGDQARELDELMWSVPPERFLPHGIAGTPEAAAAPVRIALPHSIADGGIVVNLTAQPIERPERFERLLEIVPHGDSNRIASRKKFKAYRDSGLSPKTNHL